jgi:hypothetical protein
VSFLENSLHRIPARGRRTGPHPNNPRIIKEPSHLYDTLPTNRKDYLQEDPLIVPFDIH